MAATRIRRDSLAPDGKLNILAADHPARRVTKVGDDALAMSDRRDYLARILRVLMSDKVDGLMATMDILEDLLAIDGLVREAGGKALLDGKLLIASLNRGGLAGASWELDDPITGPSPATCQAWRFDGVKILLRIADDEPGSLKTMLASAQAITECNALRLPVFLEPSAGHENRQRLHGCKNAGGTGAYHRCCLGTWRQQPVFVAEASLLRWLRNSRARHHAADFAARW